ncbi:winged helix-turn-helix domain-containing protein [Vibrio campbellii]
MKDESIVLILGDFIWKVGERKLHRVEQAKGLISGNTIVLTPKMFRLVTCLYEGRHSIVSKEQIISYVWESKPTSQESLSQLINRTRYLIEDNNKSILVNEPSIGYSLSFKEAIDQNVSVADQTSNNDVESDNDVESTKMDVILGTQNHSQAKSAILVLATLLTVLHIIYSGIKIYNNLKFEGVLQETPYPYVVSKADGRIFVTIDEHECVYEKNQLLLKCP